MNWKNILITSTAVFALGGLLTACGTDTKTASSSTEKQEISVGVTPGYSEEILEFVAKEAEKQGLQVKIQSFGDYVTPDQALVAGDIDVNSFQHGPFLTAFNEKNGTHLVSIGKTYLVPLRAYSHKIRSIGDVPDGAKIAIPNDPSNGGRSLLLLEKEGLLKLKGGTDSTKAVVGDITENPKHLEIIELEAAQLPRSLDDVTLAIVNGGYAAAAGLTVSEAIAEEDNTSPYVNIIATRKEDKDKDVYKKFVTIFQSDAVKTYILDNYKDSLVPAF